MPLKKFIQKLKVWFKKIFLFWHKEKEELISKPFGKWVKVRLGWGEGVNVEIIKENAKTFIVRLPDGHIIKRHKVKHVIT